MPSPVYYVCLWGDSDLPRSCEHQHPTIASAVACTGSACAGAYVVAVKDGKYQQLSRSEESLFQNLMYGNAERLQRLVRWFGRLHLIVS
jgi:hypothetical protein